MREPFVLHGETIAPGKRAAIDIPVSVLSNHTPVNLSVQVIHGKLAGPTLFVSAAIHGDEIIGVEIIRRLLNSPRIRGLRGTLLCVPIVNAFGFINHNRYLPDRRDLNRCFPGGPKGSLANQLAHLFMVEVVEHADFGIDIHSAAAHRTNLPQIRLCSDRPRALEMAEAFGPPVIMESPLREGSLRQAGAEVGVDVMIYEAGEALRFDEMAIRIGLKGIFRVMKCMDMINGKRIVDTLTKPLYATSSHWLRAPEGGILRAYRTTGDSVQEGDIIGIVSDPMGDEETEILVHTGGLIIGRTNLPIINQGDALFHIAHIMQTEKAEQRVGQVEKEIELDPLFDEDEII